MNTWTEHTGRSISDIYKSIAGGASLDPLDPFIPASFFQGGSYETIDLPLNLKTVNSFFTECKRTLSLPADRNTLLWLADRFLTQYYPKTNNLIDLAAPSEHVESVYRKIMA